LKPAKCKFEKKEVDFLGAQLSYEEIAIELVKVSGIKE